jgi:hypothetical protein
LLSIRVTKALAYVSCACAGNACQGEFLTPFAMSGQFPTYRKNQKRFFDQALNLSPDTTILESGMD